jgi:hypothetical protein
MAIITINDPLISVGITDSNATVTGVTIPVINYGNAVYELKTSGTLLTGVEDVGRTWTLNNTALLSVAFIVRNGATLDPSDYTITSIGTNDVVTFTNVIIFNDDYVRIIGFEA